ncbi:hypothetical protein RCOM_1435790 [Ricinus communis]|uniref:Apple domain-containing protein n=1 Tax=Ricinus communis TaxID=3988 RepID=B9RFM4_RICCO|nr:hypothetical protein RCOM_1435790 [Ricinus communis]
MAMECSITAGLFEYSVYNQDEIYPTALFDGDDRYALSRIVLNNSGLLQLLTWDNSALKWRELRSEPKYKYRHCGAYSILNANNIDSLECMCLPGYQPKYLKNWNLRDASAECTRKISDTSICGNGEGFVKIASVKVPDASAAALLNRNLSTRECKQLCLSNCSCKAFASLDIERKGVGCLTWYGD